jgi:hypothetical protein
MEAGVVFEHNFHQFEREMKCSECDSQLSRETMRTLDLCTPMTVEAGGSLQRRDSVLGVLLPLHVPVFFSEHRITTLSAFAVE